MEVNINGNELEVNGKTKMLTHAGMAIFKHLYKSSPKVVKACGIQTHLRSISRTSINQQISQLRKALVEFDGIEIITHSKCGYAMLIKNVSE